MKISGPKSNHLAMRVKNPQASILALISICLINSPVDGHSVDNKIPAITDGIKALNEGDCNKALEFFNLAAREKPDSPEAHAGRARALSELGRKDEAIKEYKLALLLNPNQNLAKMCREKLSALGVNIDGSAGSNGKSVAPATIHRQDVEASISNILKQSEERINSIHSNSESYASNIYNSHSNKHNRLIEQAKQEADEMRRSGMRFGRRFIPMFGEAEIRQRQAELQLRAAFGLERAKSDYESRKREAQSRALGVKESAEGLESQMINKPSESSGIFLIPTGTNLYVRNYGHFDPILPEPQEELRAVPLKLPQVLKLQADEAKKMERGIKHSNLLVGQGE